MTPRALAACALTSLVLTFAACGGGGDSGGDSGEATQTPATGPVSREEFLTLNKPTYAQFISAYEDAVAANPGIEADETRLRRELFNRLKAMTGVIGAIGVSPKDNTVRAQALSDDAFAVLGVTLTDGEKALVYDHPIFSAQTLISIYPRAYSASQATFDCGLGATQLEQLNDNKTDAYRHAYWNARMARDLSPDFAEAFGTAHEPEGQSLRGRMDLHNNLYGRLLAARFPTATDAELEVLLSQAHYVFVRDGDGFPDPAESLVFFAQQQALDTTLTGSLTNPDSGGPWQLSATLSHCNQTVRGTMTLVRGTSRQQRRFTGTVGTDQMPLTIDNPFVFENPNNLSYCQNMQANLAGSGTSYAGPWTATNCSLGGVITLSQ